MRISTNSGAHIQLVFDRDLEDLLGVSSPPDNLAVALTHAAAGRPVFPCASKPGFHKNGDPIKPKEPLVRWRDRATCDPDQIRRWWRQWPDAMPGMPTGRASGLAVLDLDRKDGKDGVAELRTIGLDPDNLSPCIVTTPSGDGRHLYFRWYEGLGISAGKIALGVDVRGEGGYVIAPGATGVAGAYSTADPVPDDLPAWPANLRQDARAPVADGLAAMLGDDDDPDLWADYVEAKRKRDWEPDRIRSALNALPKDRSRDMWCEAGMAVHHASGGAEVGYDLWDEWSREHPDPDMYDEKDQRRTWNSFGKPHKGPVRTIGSLYKTAKECGWNPAPPLPGADEALNELLGVSKPAAPASPLTFLSPAECAQSEPRRYIVKGLIAERDVACIVGAPGAGKSVLAPALAYAVAQGREAQGRRTRAGGVFYVAAEDEHGMRGRVTALRSEHGDAANFTLVGGVSDLLNEAVAGQGVPHFNALLKAVEERRPSLIVIDTLSMSFPRLDENSAEGMGRVVHVARALTEWGAAVVLIHHDTKGGQQGLPRGHSLLNGALDVSIYLRKEDDGTVHGRLTKNRNGACDGQIAFSIRAVEIGRDEDGDPVTAPRCLPLNANALKQAGPRLKPTERAALELVREMLGGGEEIAVREWRAAAIEDARISVNESRDARRKVADRALSALVRKKLVAVSGEIIRIHDGIGCIFDDLDDDGESDE